MRRELEIVQLRKGKGLYYLVFAVIHCCKEMARNLIKRVYFKLTGRFMKSWAYILYLFNASTRLSPGSARWSRRATRSL